MLNVAPPPISPKVLLTTTVAHSRRSKEEEHEDFSKSLSIPVGFLYLLLFVSLYIYYPHIVLFGSFRYHYEFLLGGPSAIHFQLHETSLALAIKVHKENSFAMFCRLVRWHATAAAAAGTVQFSWLPDKIKPNDVAADTVTKNLLFRRFFSIRPPFKCRWCNVNNCTLTFCHPHLLNILALETVETRRFLAVTYPSRATTLKCAIRSFRTLVRSIYCWELHHGKLALSQRSLHRNVHSEDSCA